MTKPPEPTEYSVRFGVELGRIMRENKVSQTRVAGKLGRSQSFVSEHTRGLRPVDTDVLDVVASFIPGMTPNRLFGLIVDRVSGKTE